MIKKQVISTYTNLAHWLWWWCEDVVWLFWWWWCSLFDIYHKTL